MVVSAILAVQLICAVQTD